MEAMSSSKSKRRPGTVKASTTGSAAATPSQQQRSARARLAAERERAARRRRQLLMVVVPLAVVLVAVGALVVVRLTGVGQAKAAAPTVGTNNTNNPNDKVVSQVTSVPATVLDQVGVGSARPAPQPVNAPPLTEGGKPKVLYVGAEYCPYCAAERWGLAVALSRFGTFSGLGQTTSTAKDNPASVPTLTFHGSTFSSKTIAFSATETEDVNAAPLETLSAADQKTFSTYDNPPYVPNTDRGSIPFVAIGGKYMISGASYDPRVLQNKTHEQIAAALSDPSSPIAQGADGTANLITAAICATTGNAPSSVCNSPGVVAAAKALS